jgi:hypothetical protein
MASASSKTRRSANTKSFRVGRVRAYRRGKVWYLCYRENGRRRQPRIGPDRDRARQTASEINDQLEVNKFTAMHSFDVAAFDLEVCNCRTTCVTEFFRLSLVATSEPFVKSLKKFCIAAPRFDDARRLGQVDDLPEYWGWSKPF